MNPTWAALEAAMALGLVIGQAFGPQGRRPASPAFVPALALATLVTGALLRCPVWVMPLGLVGSQVAILTARVTVLGAGGRQYLASVSVLAGVCAALLWPASIAWALTRALG